MIHAVDVYPYRWRGSDPEWLLLRRADGVRYAGTWRMVGGKVQPGEPAWRAALRELCEETGRRPRRAWTLPSANVFYEWEADAVRVLPAFAAELDADPVLCREHDAFAWLGAEEAAARLAWPEQQRLLRLADTLLRAGAVLPAWHLPAWHLPAGPDAGPSS